jgi:predicted MFS family arabinose efflux permease
MYILDVTGSAKIFANVMAISMIPTIFCSPIGGILCDKFNRIKIMILLDLLSGVCVLLFLLFFDRDQNSNYITLVLVILSVFGSILTPAIQSTVPLIADDIKRTNILVSQITSIIAMISPTLAGLLYSIFQFRVIILYVCLSFLLTAFLECFIKITCEKYLADSIKEACNFKEVVRFFYSDGKEILYFILFAGIISFFVTGLINVGIPYLIKRVLKMSTVAFGFCETASGIAAVIGTTLSPIIIRRLKLKNLYLLMIGVGLSIGGVGIGSIDISVTYIRYFEILFFVCLIHFLISIFSVTSLSIIMERTPNRFLGRILSFVATLTICLQPFGQIMYGLGLSYSSIKNFVFLVIISTFTVIVSFYCRRMFHELF